MGPLVHYSSARCLELLNIGTDDPQQIHTGLTQDLFIGQNKSITLTINNGTTVQFRDIVVLGRLIVKASDMTDTANKGRLIARDIITAGNTQLENIFVEASEMIVMKNEADFKDKLQHLITSRLPSRST